jgi:hypothetical protein
MNPLCLKPLLLTLGTKIASRSFSIFMASFQDYPFCEKYPNHKSMTHTHIDMNSCTDVLSCCTQLHCTNVSYLALIWPQVCQHVA